MNRFLDIFILSVTTFALSFCWIRYATHNNAIALWLSLVVTISLAYILHYCTDARKNKQRKKIGKKQLESLFFTLNYCEDLSKIFAPMLQFFHYQTTTIDCEHLVATRDDKRIFVVLQFDGKILSPAVARSIVIGAKRQKATGILLFCNSANGAVLSNMRQHLDTVLVDILGTYKLLKQADKLPLIQQVKKFNTPFIAQIALSKKRAKWWAISSCSAILLSFVSYVDWWLLSWATIFALLAVYCLVNKKYNHACATPSI